jgi:hypothetical protein
VCLILAIPVPQSTKPPHSNSLPTQQPQQNHQAPLAAQPELGLTIQDLEARFTKVAKKYRSPLRLKGLWLGIKDGQSGFGFMASPYISVDGQTLPGSNQIRSLVCNGAGKTPDENASTLIVFAGVVQAVDPLLTQESRNQLLKKLGFSADRNEANHLRGDCLVNGRRYRSSYSAALGTVLLISDPSDKGCVSVGAEPLNTQMTNTSVNPDLAVTPEELKNRIGQIAKARKISLELHAVQQIRKGSKHIFSFDLTKSCAVVGETNEPLHKYRYVTCILHGESENDAGEGLIGLSLFIQAMDPQLTNHSRNQILQKLGIWGEGADAEHLAGDYEQNGKRYRSANDSQFGLVVQVSVPHDTGYLPISGKSNE